MKGWPREELPYILSAAVDVAADQVGIVPLKLGRRHNASCEHALSEAGRKPFGLLPNPL